MAGELRCPTAEEVTEAAELARIQAEGGSLVPFFASHATCGGNGLARFHGGLGASHAVGRFRVYCSVVTIGGHDWWSRLVVTIGGSGG